MNFQGNRLSHVGAISIFGKHAACLRKDACNTCVFVLLYSKLKSGLGESSQFYFRRCTMGVWQIILGIVLILFSVAIIVVVLLQEGHQAGLGAITGGADTFLAKNQARTVDAFLARWTKVFAIGFFVLVIGLNALVFFAP